MPIFIQDRFTIERDGVTLQDAIVLPKEEYEKLTPEEIEVQKEERFTNWSNHIKNPPVAPVITKEEELAQVEKEIAILEEQKVQLATKKVELETAIGVKPIDPKENPKEEPIEGEVIG